MIPEPVLHAFGLHSNEVTITPVQIGLINHTWKVVHDDHAFILQQVNDAVFKKPEDISFNIAAIGSYLQVHKPGYFFVAPLKSADGNELLYIKGQGYFRMFPFVAGSHTVDTVETPEQAYEAARQFGKFTASLSGFDHTTLKTTIPHFHDLSLRYQNFNYSLKTANSNRLQESAAVIGRLKGWYHIVEKFEQTRRSGACKLRVMHHDAKISNVLFDEHNKGICVIDLDTLMPGYFFSDPGDMMRTYLCPVNEEEADYGRIDIRFPFYEAITAGYLSEMKDELTETEKTYFFFSGAFMIYMQALRFATDYLNNDMYYGSAYPGQNLVRAGNQAVLLEKFLEKEESLKVVI